MKSKTIALLLLLCILLSLVLAGCTGSQSVGYMPTLVLTGDVNQTVVVRSVNDFKLTDIQKGDRKYQGIWIQDLLAAAGPVNSEYTLLLTASDGLTAALDSTSLAFTYLVFSTENGWEAVHLQHPPSAAVKHIERMVVVNRTPGWEHSVNVIRKDGNVLQMTPGQMFANGLQEIPVFEGTSAQQAEGQDYSVSIFTRRMGVPVSAILANQATDRWVMIGKNGLVVAGQSDGFVEWRGHELRYVSRDGRTVVDPLAGIFLDPPETAITDLYRYVVADLENNRKVLVILLDGLGLHQFEAAKSMGYMPFLSSLHDVQPALAAYRPVTNVGMAAMLTGQWPAVNGVNYREREIAVPTFFQRVLEMDKKAALLEGDIGILQTEILPVLHLDLDNSGNSDDEIFAAAKARMSEDLDLLMVHFHSIDDSGHVWGDLHENVLATIRRNDDFVQALVQAWEGPVYILADHGMHAHNEAGHHGVFRFEDMMVPFIIAKGGRTP